MARGPGRRFLARLTQVIALAATLAACTSVSEAPTAVSSQPTDPVVVTTVADVATTTLPASSTSAGGESTTSTEPDAGTVIDAEVLVPDGAGPFPAVVLVHGGAWVAGSPSQMRDLARSLTAEGYLTVNARYTLSGDLAGFPVAVDDVACAVRLAAGHPDADGTVAIVGHSAGAHLGALVALDTGVYGEGCPITTPVIPDRLIGLAGPYDVTRLGRIMVPFFGVSLGDDPELWLAGNPLQQAGNHPGLSALILHGENDGLVDLSFATDFVDALSAGGADALLEIVEGARHNEMDDPDVVGDLIVTWLDR